jgi:hypothetical protein
VLLRERARAPPAAAQARGDAAALHALLRRHDVDLACLPDAAEAAQLAAALPELPDLRALLAFVHAYLVRRWLAHPLCARRELAAPAPAAFARLFPGPEPCSAP